MSISGKVVLVTGAGEGIGCAITLSLAFGETDKNYVESMAPGRTQTPEDVAALAGS
jgi:NAD(P)-dependent dehydrogenase (short-subunit alcohol dehydrogenase family)